MTSLSLLAGRTVHTRIKRGAGGTDTPCYGKHKAIGLLINTGLNPMENHKATKPAFYGGPPLAPAKRYLNGVSLVGR